MKFKYFKISVDKIHEEVLESSIIEKSLEKHLNFSFDVEELTAQDYLIINRKGAITRRTDCSGANTFLPPDYTDS